MLDDEEEFIRQKKLLEPMLVSEAWKEYERILNAQIANHMAQLMSSANPTLDGLSQVMSGEYRKGAVFGIQRAVATPYDIIRSANEIIENRHVTKEPSNAPGNSSQQPKPSVDDDGNFLPEHSRVTDLGGDE